MAFRGEPRTVGEVVAWVREQLRAIQGPQASGEFVGPPGSAGPAGPPNPDEEVWRWAAVAP